MANAAPKVTEFKAQVTPPGEKANDGLNRPRRQVVEQPDGTEKKIVWTWHTSGYGNGRGASIAYDATSISYATYDALGRVTSHTHMTGGVSYPFSYA